MDGAKESLTHTSLLVCTSICNRAANFLRKRFGFFAKCVQALEIKASELDEISYGGFLQQGGFVTAAKLCVTLGHSVTNWCADWKQIYGPYKNKCGRGLAPDSGVSVTYK
jgi:hypothetical protein